jgi:hypothetical protein
MEGYIERFADLGPEYTLLFETHHGELMTWLAEYNEYIEQLLEAQQSGLTWVAGGLALTAGAMIGVAFILQWKPGG